MIKEALYEAWVRGRIERVPELKGWGRKLVREVRKRDPVAAALMSEVTEAGIRLGEYLQEKHRDVKAWQNKK